jgi:hypothetical protein
MAIQHALHGALVLVLLQCGAASAQATTRFAASLAGGAVPAACGVPVAGTGAAVLFLHEPDNVLVYNLAVTGMPVILLAHLHAGAAGACGVLVADLGITTGSWFGRVGLTAAEVVALRGGNLYLDVHSGAGGQIRGQILLSDPSEFSVALARMPGAPPAAAGHGCFQVLPDGRLYYLVRTSALSGTAGNSASINLGTIPFALSGGPTTWTGITSGTVVGAALANLRAGMVSVTVTTALNMSGELQGPILPRRRPVVFGTACPGSSGVPAEINATNIACLGGGYQLELYAAAPGAPALLMLGASSLAGIPFGPGCRFYLDLLLLPLIPMGTGPQGWVHYNVAVPYDYSLIGGIVDAQWLVLDAVPGGLVTSNAIRARIE